VVYASIAGYLIKKDRNAVLGAKVIGGKMKKINKKKREEDYKIFMLSISGGLFLLCLFSSFALHHAFMKAHHTVDIAVNLDMVNAESENRYFDCDYSENICKDTDEWYAYGMDKMRDIYVATVVIIFIAGYMFVTFMAWCISYGKSFK
jgi:hypothetical protein